MDIYCPENYQKENGQCAPVDVVKRTRTSSRPVHKTVCFLVTRGSANITDDITTLVFLKYAQLNIQNNVPDSPIEHAYFCNKNFEVEYVCFQYFVETQDFKLFNKRTGFAIHISYESELIINLVLSVKYINTPPHDSACTNSYTTKSNYANSSTGNSKTINSNSGNLKTVNSNSGNSNSVNTNSTNSSTVDSNTIKSNTANSKKLIPDSRGNSLQLWKVVDMAKAVTILKHVMCDIGDGELDPLVNTYVWETINCQIHTDVFTNNTTDEISNIDVDVILSYSMSAVSIVSLAPTLLCNARYVSKCPLPKRLLYNQVLTLFLSHLVTVLGISANDIIVLCKIAGVLIHYLWLTMYFWTSIGAWHMYSVFALRLKKLRIVDEETVRILYLRYRLFGYLFPFLLVLPAVILDFLQWKHIYGPSICYVSDYETLLFVLLLPIAFSCLFNMLTYFTTIYHIVLNTRNMSVIKYDCVFYIKLFGKMWFMLSLTSGSAMLAIMVNNTTTWYVFICMYGVQSIASSILLCFLWDK